jgi:hypothetical protein
MSTGLCVALAGCIEAREQEVAERLNSYIGHPVSEMAIRLGPPASDTDAGDGKHTFVWETGSQTASATIPLAGRLVQAGPQQQKCRISVVAATSGKVNPDLRDWIVQQWEYEGNGCL